MFLYHRIFLAVAALIALYAQASLSAALYPHSVMSYILLALSSLFLIFIGVRYNRDKKRMSSLFVLGAAIMPYAFIAEYQYILANSKDIEAAVFESNLQHAIAVYDLFRLLFLLLCALVLLKELFLAIKNFSRQD